MAIIEKLDEYGKPAWIALIVLGFVIWWPVGLATLAFVYGSGRMFCGHRNGSKWREKMERMGATWSGPSSGNRAFDEYRTETLKRLEEEQREFHQFLNRLRMAKDKSEFDEFMAERSRRSNEGETRAAS